jgi:3-methyladenine DNA glycosylase AlkC
MHDIKYSDTDFKIAKNALNEWNIFSTSQSIISWLLFSFLEKENIKAPTVVIP